MLEYMNKDSIKFGKCYKEGVSKNLPSMKIPFINFQAIELSYSGPYPFVAEFIPSLIPVPCLSRDVPAHKGETLLIYRNDNSLTKRG